jgi:hypothetical protein
VSALTFNPRAALNGSPGDEYTANVANLANLTPADPRGLAPLAGLAEGTSPKRETVLSPARVALADAAAKQQSGESSEFHVIAADCEALPGSEADEYRQAALRRPPSWWRAEVHRPLLGVRCSCCGGLNWWSRDEMGWCCRICHPPVGAADGGITELLT